MKLTYAQFTGLNLGGRLIIAWALLKAVYGVLVYGSARINWIRDE